MSLISIIYIIFIYNINTQKIENQKTTDMFLSLEKGFKCPNTKNQNQNNLFTFITEENYKKIFNSKNPFLLYATSTWCDYCCQHSQILSDVQNHLNNHNDNLINKIKIYQIHTDKNLKILKEKKCFFSKIPTLFLFIDINNIIPYSYYFTKNNIIHFIEKNIFPIKKINSIDDIIFFLDDEKIKIKIILFITNKKENKNEIEEFKKYSNEINYRMNTEIRICENKEIIIELKEKYQNIFFDEYSLNSIVLKRYKNIYHLDLALKGNNIKEFIYYNTIEPIEELTMRNKHILSQLITPIALFFIDSCFNLNNFHKILKSLEKLSNDYDLKYVFLYVDGGAKSDSKIKLGLESNFPTVVIHDSRNTKIIKFDHKKIFSDNNIKNFLNDNLNKKNDDLIFKEKFMIKNDIIINKLKKIEYLNNENFKKILLKNDKYYLFFIVNEYSGDEKEVSKINIYAELFDIIQEYGINLYINVFWISEYDLQKIKDKNLSVFKNSGIVLKLKEKYYDNFEKYIININDDKEKIKKDFFNWLKNKTDNIFELPNEFNDDYEDLYSKYYNKIKNKIGDEL